MGSGRASGGQLADIKLSDASAVRAEGAKRLVLVGKSDGTSEAPVLLELDAEYGEQRDDWVDALTSLLARLQRDAAAAAEEKGLEPDEEDASMVGQVKRMAQKREYDMRRQTEMREAEAARQVSGSSLMLMRILPFLSRAFCRTSWTLSHIRARTATRCTRLLLWLSFPHVRATNASLRQTSQARKKKLGLDGDVGMKYTAQAMVNKK